MLPLLGFITLVYFHAAIGAHLPFTITTQRFAAAVLFQDFAINAFNSYEHSPLFQRAEKNRIQISRFGQLISLLADSWVLKS